MKYDYFFTTTKFDKKVFKVRAKLYNKLIPKDIESLLEIGVGNGYMLFYCWGAVRYLGLEENQKNAYFFRDNNCCTKDNNVICRKAPEFLEHIRDKFDIIFTEHLVEHFKDYGEMQQFLRSCKQLLEPGGKIILLYPDIEKIKEVFWHDYTHSFITTKKRIEDILYDEGYEIVKSKRYWLCFIGVLSYITVLFKPFMWLLPHSIKLNLLQHSLTIARIKE